MKKKLLAVLLLTVILGCSVNVVYAGGTSVQNPVFTVEKEQFTGSLDVVLTCETPSAKIYYNKGSMVTSSNAIEYTEPIKITDTTTIYAVARLDNGTSEQVSKTYTKHTHNFEFLAAENVLKATCVSGCPNGYDTTPLTLTLNAPSSLTYDGQPKEVTYGSNEAEAWKRDVGSDPPEIRYIAKNYYELIAGKAVNADEYTASIAWKENTASLDFTVAPKEIVITWDKTKFTYNGQNQCPTATTPDMAEGDSFSPNYIVSKGTTRFVQEYKNAGTYSVYADFRNNNYEIADGNNEKFMIAPKELTITDATTTDKTYDGTKDATVTAVTLEGFLTGETLTKDTDYTVSGEYDSADAGTDRNVTVTVTLSDTEAAGNYKMAGTYMLTGKTIREAELTVTAKDKSISCGDEASNDGVDYSGFVNSETADILNGTLTYTYQTSGDTPTAYTPSSPAGTYDIIPGGLTSDNYKITFVKGTLTVMALSHPITNNAPESNKETNHGYLTIDKTSAAQDETVTITVISNSGYQMKTDSLKATYGSTPTTLTLTQDAQDATKYTFTMPGEAVTVTAEFEETPHTHDFRFTAEKNVLKATCTSRNCPDGYDADPLTLTLTAPSSLVYDGQPKEVIYGSDEVEAWKLAGLTVPTIGYVPLEKLTDGKPVNPGTYTASAFMSVMDGAAMLDFEISMKVIPVEMIVLNPDTLTLKPGESQKVTVTVYPENATDKTLTWTADVSDVAKIGEDGTVTALKEGTVKVTVTAKNGVFATGTITVRADPVQPVNYEIIQGAKQVVLTTASEAIFASDADFSKFVDVLLDGKVLSKSSYTAKSGSTVITLMRDIIKQLKPGIHTLTIKSTDGKATTTFTIENPPMPPKTGDSANLGLWGLLLLTAIVGMALTWKKARNQH